MSTQSESDLHLVLQARSGNVQAYERIVMKHQAAVCATAYAVVRDVALSEDIGQEAFVAGWRKLEQVREPDKLGSWLCGIARNEALQAMRRRKPVAAIDAVELPSPDSPEETLEQADRARLVSEALEQVPERCRVALILFYREGRSVREVARALDLTEEAVKQRISRGRKHMRGQLEQWIGDELEQSKPTASFALMVMTQINASVQPAADALQDQISSVEASAHGPVQATTSGQLRRGALRGLLSPLAALVGVIALAVVALVVVAATYASTKTSQFGDEQRATDGSEAKASARREVVDTEPPREHSVGDLAPPSTSATLTNSVGQAGQGASKGDVFEGKIVIAGTTVPCVHTMVVLSDPAKLTTFARAWAVTDDEGMFRFVGVPPGRYLMNAMCRERGKGKARIANEQLFVSLPDKRIIGWPVTVPDGWKTLRSETLAEAPKEIRLRLQEGEMSGVLSDEEIEKKVERSMDTDGDGTISDRERRVYEELLNHSLLVDEERARVKSSSYGLTEYRDDALLEVPTEGHLTEGPVDAPVTIVTVIRTGCPYSLKAEVILKQLRADYPGRLRIVRRLRSDFTDGFGGAKAYCAAMAQDGAAEFLATTWDEATIGGDFSERNMLRIAAMVGLDKTLFARDMSSDACVKQVKDSTRELDELGIRATPTWVINGQVVRGVRDLSHYRPIIEDKLGQSAP